MKDVFVVNVVHDVLMEILRIHLNTFYTLGKSWVCDGLRNRPLSRAHKTFHGFCQMKFENDFCPPENCARFVDHHGRWGLQFHCDLYLARKRSYKFMAFVSRSLIRYSFKASLRALCRSSKDKLLWIVRHTSDLDPPAWLLKQCCICGFLLSHAPSRFAQPGQTGLTVPTVFLNV